ncbi:hypothetical protein [Brachybacterium paraconglomeratum]|uniref:hypothetical protein n=1 Tax=Brachybacterium paraconglomeratum TaxID=173362 RepID=UPI0022AECB02|nr:hypothetical protein [Brachybacterium paraconglomeratum]MCZ4324760.1 hypothetical protein [Brachybacterium paraconglomeratum]
MADFNTDTPRGVIAQRIDDAHPSWRVDATPDAPDHLGRGGVFVAVYRTTIGKPAGAAALAHSVTVDLYGAATLSASAEDRLDDLLDDLLTTIAAMGDVVWTNAQRTTFDSFHGWRITLDMHSADVYASAARKRA